MTTTNHEKEFTAWLWRLEWGQTEYSRKTEIEEVLLALGDEQYWAEDNLHFEVEPFSHNEKSYVALRLSYLDPNKPEFFDTETEEKVSLDIGDNTKRLDDVWLLFSILDKGAYVSMTYNSRIKTLNTFINLLRKKEKLIGVTAEKMYDSAKIARTPNQATKIQISGRQTSLENLSQRGLINLKAFGLGDYFTDEVNGYECEVKIKVKFKPKKNKKNQTLSKGPSTSQQALSPKLLEQLENEHLNLRLDGTEYCFDTNQLQMKTEFKIKSLTSSLKKADIFVKLATLLEKEQIDNGLLLSPVG
ncbi:MAG: hypothetical protein H2174_06455 [Vampirovibrio sp.]|nr:hypothetical protein [Vampirovibrio sp.]